jgi:exopolysaccharide biosynthesis polyprenyl glycosylphosphotransferase
VEILQKPANCDFPRGVALASERQIGSEWTAGPEWVQNVVHGSRHFKDETSDLAGSTDADWHSPGDDTAAAPRTAIAWGLITAAALFVLALVASSRLGQMWLGLGAPLALVGSRTALHQARSRRRVTRIAVIGSSATTTALGGQLEGAALWRHVIVGSVAPGAPCGDALGSLADVRDVIQRHRIDLLLMTSEVSRRQVFDVLAESCVDLDVRLMEAASFYEEQFGHVPVGEINNAWFQYVLHPRFRADGVAAKRAFDVAVALAMAILFLPVLVIAALLIALDGGSPIFRQTRIGARGRPFAMYKLRTMHRDVPDDSQWATADDGRVTTIGRILRTTHLDELPQLLNVLRGEMSIVGPRPEQPHYASELEQTVPFYSRRIWIKPGMTGWAQVHCGYAGSELGTLHKICHDLYYIKHRSLRFDLRILCLTIGAVVLDRQRQFRALEGMAPFALARCCAPAADESTGASV